MGHLLIRQAGGPDSFREKGDFAQPFGAEGVELDEEP
jgi:hypothetical protein